MAFPDEHCVGPPLKDRYLEWPELSPGAMDVVQFREFVHSTQLLKYRSTRETYISAFAISLSLRNNYLTKTIGRQGLFGGQSNYLPRIRAGLRRLRRPRR
jgi:hypothetical protein